MLKYFKSHKPLLLYYMLSLVLAPAYAGLIRRSLTDFLYTAALLTGAFVMVAVVAGALYRRRLRALLEVLRNIGHFEQQIPPGNTAVEEAYAHIAEGLRQRLSDETQRLKKHYAATESYYTLWLHQIKTPISAIRLLAEEPAAKPGQVKRELFEIERYVDMALQYVRSTALENDIVITKCDIEPIVRESVKKYAALFIAKNIGVTVGELPARAYTDGKWLAFILEQLLSNAVKYTKAGQIHIHKKDGALVVADTGIGIRPEDLPRVFEHGYTGYNGRLDKRASGIGLFLTKRVAGALNIRLELVSAPGEGTQARLYFPQHPPQVVE
ncbi:MAG: sensor histidine kinase [Clostridiales bacterium]|jgi:signal transduction histidine kinase|nr:sensor histidine kinase [Clostridiales bacterium]